MFGVVANVIDDEKERRAHNSNMNHAPKAALVTPERVEQFTRYYRHNCAWGIFHCALDDGNWWCTAYEKIEQIEDDPGWLKELPGMAEYFNMLTSSQRRKLGKKAEARAEEMFQAEQRG